MKNPQAPRGIRVDASATGTADQIVSLRAGDPFTSILEVKGLRGHPASITQGEDFGGEIAWDENVFQAQIAVVNCAKTGKPVLLMETGQLTCVYRGFEEATNTWWRWEHEADPTQYREHCIRVLSLSQS